MRCRNFCPRACQGGASALIPAVCPAGHKASPETHQSTVHCQPFSQASASHLGTYILVKVWVSHVLIFPILGPAPSLSLASLKPSTFDPVPFCKLTARADFQVLSLASPSRQGGSKGDPGGGAPSRGRNEQNRTDGETRRRLGLGTTGSPFQIPFPSSAAAFQGSQLRWFRSWGP